MGVRMAGAQTRDIIFNSFWGEDPLIAGHCIGLLAALGLSAAGQSAVRREGTDTTIFRLVFRSAG